MARVPWWDGWARLAPPPLDASSSSSSSSSTDGDTAGPTWGAATEHQLASQHAPVMTLDPALARRLQARDAERRERARTKKRAFQRALRTGGYRASDETDPSRDDAVVVAEGLARQQASASAAQAQYGIEGARRIGEAQAALNAKFDLYMDACEPIRWPSVPLRFD